MFCLGQAFNVLNRMHIRNHIKDNEKCHFCNGDIEIDDENNICQCNDCRKRASLFALFSIKSNDYEIFCESIKQAAQKENVEIQKCALLEDESKQSCDGCKIMTK